MSVIPIYGHMTMRYTHIWSLPWQVGLEATGRVRATIQVRVRVMCHVGIEATVRVRTLW